MKGTVKWYNPQKGYGFITKPDGKEIFLHKDQLPKRTVLKEGDEIEFNEAQGRGGKGPKATNVKLVAKAAAQAAPSTKGTKAEPTSEAKKVEPPVPKGVGIGVYFAKWRLEGDSLIIPIFVVVKEDGNLVPGTAVEVSAEGATTIKPKARLSTRENGLVDFDVYLPKETTQTFFLVKALRKEVPERWSKEASIDTPIVFTENIDLQVNPAPAAEWMVFDITITAAKKLVTTEIGITVRSKMGSILSVREASSATWETINPSGTVFPCRRGHLTLYARIAELAPGLNGDDVIFEIDGTTVTESRYISGRYLVPTSGQGHKTDTQPTITTKE